MKNTKNQIIGIGMAAALVGSAGAAAVEGQQTDAHRAEVRSVIASGLANTNADRGEYVWGRAGNSDSAHAPKAQQGNFRWAAVATPDSSVAGVRDFSDQTYATRSTADQQGFKWGIRSAADQQGFKWGIRSAADQQGFKWGIR